MIQTECMNWDAATSTVADEWSALVARGGYNPTLDPAWMDAAIRSHDCVDHTVVVTAREDSRLIGVLPVICRRERIHGLPLRTVDLASNLVSYHPQIVADHSRGELLAAALAVAHGGAWDLFRANQIPADCPTARLLEERFAAMPGSGFRVPGESSPYVVLQGSWEGLLQSRSRNFRSNRNRALRNVESYGVTSTRWFVERSDTKELLDQILHVEARSWKAGENMAISSRPMEQDYYRRLLDVLAARGALLANVLYVQDRPVAYVLCCNWRGWVGHLKTSFDGAYNHVGARVIDESIRRAIELGATEYDFLGDATRHKLHWTDRIRNHFSYWQYARTPFGRLLALAKRAADALRSR